MGYHEKMSYKSCKVHEKLFYFFPLTAKNWRRGSWNKWTVIIVLTVELKWTSLLSTLCVTKISCKLFFALHCTYIGIILLLLLLILLLLCSLMILVLIILLLCLPWINNVNNDRFTIACCYNYDTVIISVYITPSYVYYYHIIVHVYLHVCECLCNLY